MQNLPYPPNEQHWTRRELLTGMLAATACWSVARANPAGQSRPATVEVESSGFLKAPGGSVWWQRFGSGSKTPVLVVHGGPGAAHNYLLPLRALADERAVIFYDQLGCGLSDAPENEPQLYRLDRFVRELDAVRSALNLDRVILYAHAWGTMIAIEYMISGRGAGVEQLILGGAIASMPQYVAGLRWLAARLPNEAGARMLELEATGRTATAEYSDLLQLFHRRHVLRSMPSSDSEATFAFLNRSPARRVLYGVNHINVKGNVEDWDRRKDLAAIKVPTLLTTGEYDAVTLDCHEAVRDHLGGSKLRVLSGCSHMTMQESPEAYNGLLRAFLA